MTTEEKAKAYDKALGRAKEMYDTYRFSVDPSNFNPTDFEYIFPQLAESEDERMRKRAIAILKQQRDYWSYDGPADKFPPATPRKDLVNAIDVALSYLENQKEQKPVEWSEDDIRIINTTMSFLKDFADKGYENAVECMDWLDALKLG